MSTRRVQLKTTSLGDELATWGLGADSKETNLLELSVKPEVEDPHDDSGAAALA